MSKIAVLGSGSWGVTLANVLAEKNNDVVVWTIDSDVEKDINENHQNTKFLGDIPLSPELTCTQNIDSALDKADIIMWAIPTQVIRLVLSQNDSKLNKNIIHISVSKGLEASTDKRVSEIFSEFGISNYVYLAGPSHAEEVAKKQATTLSSISTNPNHAKTVQELFNTDNLRVYTNDDLIGTELSGAFKNVVAIAAGICDGYGLGDNAKAALMTRSLVEFARLLNSFGANKETIMGLTGIGDLIATCTSLHSRNRHVGNELGLGKSLEEILDSMVMVAEGVKTCEAFYNLAKKKHIEMPLVEATYNVMFNNASVPDTVKELMTRQLKSE